MIWLHVSWLVLRELIRAALAPIQFLLYLPQRNRWRREAEEVLAHQRDASDPAIRERFVSRARGSGRVFFSVGETSGEAHAVKVLNAVRQAGGDGEFSCFGGPALEAAGARLLYPLSDRAVMGLGGVLKALPFVLGAVARFLRMLADPDERPDLVVLVDYPGLHLVLARLARRRGIPVLHYIAPQYWAWGPWRMQRYKRSVDATLTILPFETAFFDKAGIPSEYVGHPLLDRPAESADDLPEEEFLCILPGSRRKEIELNLPGMLRIVRQLRDEQGDMPVILPHVDARRRRLIESMLASHGADFVRFREGSIGPVLAAARLVIAKSGTGSLESCLQGAPTIVVYKLHGWFARFFARHGLSVPFIASANLIAGRSVIPEYCFGDDTTWDTIADKAARLWRDGGDRDALLEGIEGVKRRLGQAGASARVACWILPFCRT